MKSVRLTRALWGALILACWPATGHAQDQWPSRVMTWVVPVPAGGTVDQPARSMAEHLRAKNGWQIVIENRPGASGMIGTGQVAKAKPDGYTWGFVLDTHMVNPLLKKDMPFDTVKDLEPVMLLGRFPFVIVTNVERPYKDFTDVVAAARKKPGAVTFGTAGPGTIAHLALTQLQKEHGFELMHVPYPGGPPAVQDVLGNNIDLYIGSPSLVAAHIKAGRMRALAFTGRSRSELLPDVPTLDELGFTGFSAQAIVGAIAPAGIPRPIFKRFHAELQDALHQPATKNFLTKVAGAQMGEATPEEFKTYIDDEMNRWGKIIRDANLKVE